MDRKRAALTGAALAALAVLAAILLLWEPGPGRGPAVPRASGAARVEQAAAAAAPRAAVELEAEPAAPPPAEPREDAPREEPSAEIELAELPGRSALLPPPGVIEVRVIRGREPAGAWVELDRRKHRPMRQVDLARPAEHLARQRSGADGGALFTDLEPGEYVVRALLDDGAALEERVALEARSGRRVFLLFGAGGIRGRVFEPDGAPRPGAVVLVSARHPPMRARAVSGPDGAYSAAGLRAGSYFVSLMPPDLGADADVASFETELAPGAWRTVDFGSPLPLARWRGALRLEDGSLAAGPLQVLVRDLERGTEAWFATSPDGAIDRELLPGRYELTCAGFDGRTELGEIVLRSGSQRRDLILPSAQVSGRLLSDRSPAAAQSIQVALAPVGEPRVVRAPVRHRERFAFVGVPPGEYELTVWPGYEVPPTRVVVPPGAARVEVDIDVPPHRR